MSDDRKVIPLNAKFKKHTVAATTSDLRAAATGTIAFILFLMVGFNFSMFDVKRSKQFEMNQKMQRGIASVPKMIEPQWRRNLSALDAASIKASSRPSLVDTLNFGILEGNYAMTLDNGNITNIAFNSDKAEPKALGDRMGFIQQHAGALAPGLKAVEKMRVEASDAGFKETYKVESTAGVRFFEFQIDGQSRFLSLNVTK